MLTGVGADGVADELRRRAGAVVRIVRGGLVRYGHLLWSLTARDLKVRYKQSALGVAWAVLVPLSMMLVFTFVFTRTSASAVAPKVSMPYPLYAYLGLVPWTFFAASLNGCVNCLVANRNLVTKVYFPREVFPLSCVGSSFVDFLIASAVLVLLAAYFQSTSSWRFQPGWALLFVPVVVAVQVMLTVGLGMILAMGNLFYRDVRQVFSVAIQLGMFVSGVVVPAGEPGTRLGELLSLNPMVTLIGAYRECFAHGRMPEVTSFMAAGGVSAVVFVVGWWMFRRASYRFAECI